MTLLEQIRDNAKKVGKRIVLPEGEEERTLKAADVILGEGIAQLVLIGNPDTIAKEAEKFGLKNISKATIVDTKSCEKKQAYAELMAQIRAAKGMTVEKALKQLDSPYYLGTLMIKAGDADGMVAGAICSTADTIRPALQYIKTAPGVSTVSGAFVVVVPKKEYGQDGVFLFADCAVTIAPTAQQLADIAVISAKTAKALAGIDPKVAMLSFSTKGSAQSDEVDKVVEATKLAKAAAPELDIDGEMQADAAMVQKVADLKAPGSNVAGKANVLVFPSLEAGNIGYKLVQRLAGADAVGPILQGMAAPVNDLSRGCYVEDIINMVAITALQAAAK
ncbi:MAG: phosphate acetyltransferase [Bacteroidales bacterium]|jgi:phosphate acetyltransferase|nr:phosphate acetyltransferase [Bacteroidales bacterium]